MAGGAGRHRAARPVGGRDLGAGERFGIVPLVDGRIYLYATAATGPGTKPADHHAELARRFGTWHDPIPALLDRLDPRNPEPVDVLHHDFHELASPLPRFHSGRVALLGDAAHAMTPNMGQGGCQAIEDAVVLAHALASDADVPAALAAYTESRHRRTTLISRRSRRIGDLARLSHPSPCPPGTLPYGPRRRRSHRGLWTRSSAGIPRPDRPRPSSVPE